MTIQTTTPTLEDLRTAHATAQTELANLERELAAHPDAYKAIARLGDPQAIVLSHARGTILPDLIEEARAHVEQTLRAVEDAEIAERQAELAEAMPAVQATQIALEAAQAEHQRAVNRWQNALISLQAHTENVSRRRQGIG